MNTSRATYETRMHRVLRHIERNIAEPVELAELARVANFSAFHFHRLFAAWTGERVGDFVRRRRLEVAATRLVAQPQSSVLSIALAVGFGSAEAFARAFKLQFGEPPSAWRRREADARKRKSNRGQHDRNPDQALASRRRQHGPLQPPNKELPMNVRVETRAPASVAYLRHVGPYGESIARFWIDSVAPWMAANGLLGHARYGISRDDPSVVKPAKCRYDACVEVPDEVVLSGKAQRTTLPGGRYALLEFNGDARAIGEAWTALLRDWLPASGLQLDNRPCFEHYPAARAERQRENAFSCRLCVPVMDL